MPAPDQPVDQALPAVLRQLRETRGLSQEATAQAAAIALNTYSRIERGQTSPAWPSVAQRSTPSSAERHATPGREIERGGGSGGRGKRQQRLAGARRRTRWS